jgi:hypothetical protein
MSQRAGGMNAQERAQHKVGYLNTNEVERRWHKEHEQAKLDAGFVLIGGTEVRWGNGTRIIGGKWFKAEPEEGPDYCRECCTWDTQEGIYMMTCFLGGYEGLQCQFGHDHHEGEVWLA